MKARRGYCLAYDRDGYRLLATENCWIFEFDVAPLLADVTYVLGDRSLLQVGDRVEGLGGRHTSAGYRTLDLERGYLEFSGAFTEPDGISICLLFRWSEMPDPLTFYGWGVVATRPLQLAFSTPARSSRVVETTFVTRAPPKQ